ncbi:hypothetical protein G5714_008505 [Onychostoma macrolepis]|uniref:Secreted protein n=1 Tax=Onychostoma macrolepis TaxID=369639 RepID=A0A7J6CWS7_9TELE|nr:hypothetical protein G5714_008505 [Onychostoma macrolepis]
MGLHGVLCSLAASLGSRGFQAVSATAEVLCGLGCAAFGVARARDSEVVSAAVSLDVSETQNFEKSSLRWSWMQKVSPFLSC